MKLKLLSLLSVLSLFFGPAALAQTKTATINPTTTYQTIEGIGGAICFYNGWFTAHPYKEEIYSNAFGGLNISMLRLGNWYRYQANPNFDTDAREFVQKANQYQGRAIPVYMSSWAPPAFLKNNGEVGHGGSLIYTNGGFAYGAFAKYWYDALVAYDALGVRPSWISIQNEPDFEADYDSCIFRPTEQGTNFASYSIALDRVHRELTNLPAPPKLLAPEVVHVAFNTLANYAATMDPNDFYGVAHHLYGDGGGTADSYLNSMRAATNIFPNKPRFMTEYGELQDLIGCAHLMHNSLVVEQVSGYNHWNLLWPGASGGLIQTEFPWDQNQWTNAPPGTPTQSRGWWITPAYWAMKHFSYYIQPGFRRVNATDNDNNVMVSAYLSPDGFRLVAVLINTNASVAVPMNVNFGAFAAANSSVFQTVSATPWQSLGTLASPLSLPPRSLTTVVLDQSIIVGAASSPTPATGASGVSLNSALNWTPGSNAVTHAVYFGTSSNAVANATPTAPEFRGFAATNNFPLSSASWSTTYYWRVDEIAYSSTNAGSVWAFTTAPAVQLPPPWQSQDFGGAVSQSSAMFNNGVFSVAGGGVDIWGTSDAFRFAYLPMTGNGTITARVLGVQNTDPWAKAGVMIRASLTANSAHAFVPVTPGNGVAWQYRTTTGGTSVNNNTGGFAAPYWVRLVRSGNTFTGYRSPDGVTWTQIGSTTISMAATVYVGLAVTSHSPSSLCTATFDNVTAPGWTVAAPPAVPANLVGAVDSEQVVLAWAPALGATNYYVKRALTDGGPYETIASGPATNYTDLGLVNGTTYFYVVSASNQAGESPNSMQVSLTPQVFPITDLTANAVSSGQITLTWNPSLNATGYSVKRSLLNGGPYQTVATDVSATNYHDLSLAPGTVYHYVVSAVSGGAESADSAPATATTLAGRHGDLVHRYSFGESGGSTIADSVAGPIWNGTLLNGGTLAGGTLTLASSSFQYGQLPAGIVASLSNFTVMVWVNLASASDWTRLIEFGTGTETSLYVTPKNGLSGTLRFGITTNGSGGEVQINSAATVSPGGWHQVAVSLGGGVGVLYLDGAPVGTNASLTLTPASLGITVDNFIGRSVYSVPTLNGAVDEVRIYDTRLNAAEIAASAALGAGELLSTNSPLLSVAAVGPDVILAWPLANAGYTVQSCTDPGAGQWENVPAPGPQIVGAQWQMTLPISEGPAAVFYRLMK